MRNLVYAFLVVTATGASVGAGYFLGYTVDHYLVGGRR
jgi:hypothetical protein